jgi:NADH-quinone oxidoreductase subunit J
MAALLFYLFAAITLGTAILVVVSKNAVNSAMFFLLSLMGTASLFVLLDAFLLAVLLVLVYAGAVVALFLFIIMLLDMHGGDRKPFKRTTMVASAFAAILLGLGVLGFVQRMRSSSVRAGRRRGGRRHAQGVCGAAVHDLPPARADRRFSSAHRHARRHCAEQAV